jgi:DNA polymerase III subunit epsilon
MDSLALWLGLLAGLAVVVLVVGLWRLLRRASKTAAAHTETRPAQGTKPAKQQSVTTAPPVAPMSPPAEAAAAVEQVGAAALASGPVAVLMTYTKADGSTRVRDLTIYSRNFRDGQTHSLNCRQAGEQITKQFLLSGISRLELPGLVPALVLSNAEEIAAWLERHIAERTSTSRKSRPSPEPASGSAVAEPSAVKGRGALPTFPPLPQQKRQRPPASAQAAPLPELLPDGACGFAVLDLETTGTSRSCRIVEVALVRLDSQGRITEEWETLVQPGMPIPNAHIHGIDDALVSGAPSFEEIAGTLAAKLHEHVLVAHNLAHFDGPILEAHFAQVDGIELSLGSGLDTMPQPRVKLVELCRKHGVVLDPGVAHTALGDTRALAKALQSGMAHLAPADSPVSVGLNRLLSQPARTLTRAMAAATKAPSGWMPETIQLDVPLDFITTGPASMNSDTEIKRAEAHGIRLGFEYRKVNSIPKRNPPTFLLSTSLTLANRKMADARDLQVPVVLCRDFMQARCGSSVRAWRYQA